MGEAAAALRPRITAATPATTLSARSTQPATVSTGGQGDLTAVEGVGGHHFVDHRVAPQPDRSKEQRQRPQRPAQGFPGHVGSDQQQPGEAKDQREEHPGRLVDVVQLAPGIGVHGRAQLLHEPQVKAADQRVGHCLAARQLRELVEGEQVQIPEQEQAGHDSGDDNQIAVALCLLRCPAGGRIDHRREMVLGDRRVGAVLFDPLRGCLGHGSIIARPARPSAPPSARLSAPAVHCQRAPIVWDA